MKIMQRRKLFQWVMVPVAVGLLAFVVWGAWTWWSIPAIPDFKDCYTTRLYQVAVCPRAKSFVRSQTLPEHVRWSFILAEDGSFYQHQGVDWFEIQKSFAKNWQAGGFVRGGSTITQQLAKNLFLSKDKTITRKIKELILARRLEKQLNKTRILDLYLNVIEFGKNLYGLRAASRHYFEKSPHELTVFESIFLASLLPSPVAFQSGVAKGGAHPRHRFLMKVIAQRLRHYGKIAEEDYQTVAARLDQDAPLDEPQLPENENWADLSVQEIEERYFRNEFIEDSAFEAVNETSDSPVGQDNEEGEQNTDM